MAMLNNQRVSKFHWKELETTNQRLAKAAIHLFRVSIATGWYPAFYHDKQCDQLDINQCTISMIASIQILLMQYHSQS
jgi:hypothetical protein